MAFLLNIQIDKFPLDRHYNLRQHIMVSINTKEPPDPRYSAHICKELKADKLRLERQKRRNHIYWHTEKYAQSTHTLHVSRIKYRSERKRKTENNNDNNNMNKHLAYHRRYYPLSATFHRMGKITMFFVHDSWLSVLGFQFLLLGG